MNYIGILRGINVSGRNILKMDDLKLCLTDLDLRGVKTYIQSGNLLFHSDKPARDLELLIHEKILSEFGFNVPVQIRTLEQMEESYAKHPFWSKTEDLSQLHITFIDDQPDQTGVDEMRKIEFIDQYEIQQDAIYLYCPGGYGKTKLNNTYLEKKLKVQATTRNMKTVGKLIELARA